MEKERERNINVQEKHLPVACRTPPAGDLAPDSGVALAGNPASWFAGRCSVP